METLWTLEWKLQPQMRVAAFSAERYVIAVKAEKYATKIFQILFGKDGSIFITTPYLNNLPGRVGILNVAANTEFPTDIKFGENCPVTSHLVKYSHHPSGRSHFSLTGKVRSDVGKQSTPLHLVNGHLFTLMIQGMRRLSPLKEGEKSNRKRGIVPFSLFDNATDSVKFIGHLYAHSELSRIIHGDSKSPWNIALSSKGERRQGILLATPFKHRNQPHYLQLTMENIPTINEKSEVFLSFLGGFDERSRAFDHSMSTSCLLSLYPQSGDIADLAREFGTIDISG